MAPRFSYMRVSANGIDFNVAVSGPKSAPPALFLHGFPEGWMSWRPVMRRLGHLRIYAPDLRGYGDTDSPSGGYDLQTLTDDVKGLIEALELDRPALVAHDWGGLVSWVFAHRYSELISRLVIVNCTHPRTLVRAILRFEDLQTFRVPQAALFEIPWLPERVIASPLGARLLKLSFTLREGRPGTMDRALVDEIVARYRTPGDVRGPIDYYRQAIMTLILPGRRTWLNEVYEAPIGVPTTLIFGERDEVLSAKVARKSARDAGCPVEDRPLPDVGHIVSMEAPDELAAELLRLMPAPAPAPRKPRRARAPAAAAG